MRQKKTNRNRRIAKQIIKFKQNENGKQKQNKNKNNESNQHL